MGSTLGGDDPDHDLSPEEKALEIRRLQDLAREFLGKPGKARERQRILRKLNELARRKSKRSHQG